MKFLQVYAVVDTEHRLLWVGGEWDEFALQNAGKTSTANAVLSTSLMSHIAGDESRTQTARLIDTVLNSKKPVRLEYRCDSPNMARKFLLTIQPMKDNRALMVHDLRDAWHFSPPLRPWQYDRKALDCKCSFCGDVRLDGAQSWETCDELRERHPTHVTYDVCPRCRVAVDEAIEVALAKPTTATTVDSSNVEL